MKTFLFALFCTVSVTTYAQTSDAEMDAIINLLAVQKREAMGKMVAVPAKDSAAFWKVYDEYLKKNKELARSRVKLYEQTAYAYGSLTGPSADSLAKRYFSNRMDQEKSLEEYYKKMKAATNSVVAFQFYQSEVYLLTMVRASIMQQIPTYGEIRLSAKKE